MGIPVTIISGFLGAGKTTLLNRLLAESGERLAVLVNDFADINIDASLIESASSDRIALSNGCVCCTIREDLVSAALTLAHDNPARIIVETSGVSDPYAVMEAFFAPEVEPHLTVESTICLVDGEMFPTLDFSSGELAISQAAVSDIVLLNKCDLLTDAQIACVEETLWGAQKAMRILRTANARAPIEILLGNAHPREATPSRRASAEMHNHGQDYTSLSCHFETPIFLLPFENFVARLPRSVLRAKGVLRIAAHPNERAIFQLVGKRSSLTLEPASPAYNSEMVFIGSSDSFDRGEIQNLLDGLRPAFSGRSGTIAPALFGAPS